MGVKRHPKKFREMFWWQQGVVKIDCGVEMGLVCVSELVSVGTIGEWPGIGECRGIGDCQGIGECQGIG